MREQIRSYILSLNARAQRNLNNYRNGITDYDHYDLLCEIAEDLDSILQSSEVKQTEEEKEIGF